MVHLLQQRHFIRIKRAHKPVVMLYLKKESIKKYLCLDIDGVLNTQNDAWDCRLIFDCLILLWYTKCCFGYAVAVAFAAKIMRLLLAVFVYRSATHIMRPLVYIWRSL